MWYNQCLEHIRFYQCITWLVSFIKLRLKDQFQQAWHSSLENSSKALNYKLFKDIFETDDYLEIPEKIFSVEMCRFRITNHKLPIEQGRRNNIGRSNRLCIGCNNNDIGDEFHYIFECKNSDENRKCCMSNIYFRNANVIQFRKLIYDITNKLLLKLL